MCIIGINFFIFHILIAAILKKQGGHPKFDHEFSKLSTPHDSDGLKSPTDVSIRICNPYQTDGKKQYAGMGWLSSPLLYKSYILDRCITIFRTPFEPAPSAVKRNRMKIIIET